MGERAVVSIDALRERIRALEGARVETHRVPTGVQALDRLTEGLPVPGLIELFGARGSGRTRLALELAASSFVGDRPVAWVDAVRCLHPPAAAALGVRLERLLVLRPQADRVAWSVEQVLRSGCFPLVVVVEPGRIGRAGQRWARAAEAGHACLVVVGQRADRAVPADLRIAVAPGELVVVRDRSGHPGGSGPLPPPPEGADPWR